MYINVFTFYGIINGTYKAQLPSIIITHWGVRRVFLSFDGRRKNGGKEDFTDIFFKNLISLRPRICEEYSNAPTAVFSSP